jgi:serine protease Do
MPGQDVMQEKEPDYVRKAYGIASSLLLGGAGVSLAVGLPASAQVAQNDEQTISQIVPRAGAPMSFADLTQQLQPAVVNISVRQKVEVPNPMANSPLAPMFGGGPQSRIAEGAGSGFFISPDGYIVTNNHVVSIDGKGPADSVTVRLSDGTELDARIVGRDQESDIAVLKVDARKTFPFVRFGQSAKARAGDWIVAIGNPFGLGGTVTSGIISSVNRNTGSGAYDHYIQTDASINSGNSGGPMFDMSGKVIGINNWIIAPGGGNVGIGFAIPADIARPIVDKLIKGTPIERGYVGVSIVRVTNEIADSLGLDKNRGELVQFVQPDSPGAKAGIQTGDIVLAVNGEEVTPDRTLAGIVSDVPPGTRIPVEILRKGKRTTLQVTVTKRPGQQELAKALAQGTDQSDPFDDTKRPGEGLADTALGLQVLDMTAEIARRLRVPETTQGVVILAVDTASDAANKQLARGDIILSVNYTDVRNVADLEAVLRASKAQNRPTVLLQILRPGQRPGYIPLRMR